MKKILLALLFVGCNSNTTHLNEGKGPKPVLDCGFVQVFQDDGVYPAVLGAVDEEGNPKNLSGFCRSRFGLQLGFDCRFEQEDGPAFIVRTFVKNGTNDEYAVLSYFGSEISRRDCTR